MSGEDINPDSCQVDFYLLDQPSPGASHIACDLALMAAERNQKIFVITPTETAAEQLDELMWQYPEDRFLPHARSGDQYSGRATIIIGELSDLNPTDVVINLCPEAVPQLDRFSRVLEIVPYADDQKVASRLKYKTYRSLGFNPRTHKTRKSRDQ